MRILEGKLPVSVLVGVAVVFALAIGVFSSGGASAMAPIKVGPGDLEPDVFPAINPCSGEGGLVTVTPGKGIIHEFETSSGHSHFVLSLHQGVITTTDGYTGKANFQLAQHTNADSGTFMNVINQQLSDGNGNRIRVHLGAQFTFANGRPVVEFEMLSVDCLGNHNDS